MKIHVNRSRCEGHAICAMEAPELFDHDDDGALVVLDETPNESRGEDARRAADACPTQALSISS
jgi:ferredoxin